MLAAPEAVQVMLDVNDLAGQVLSACCRIGSAGSVFIPAFFERLDRLAATPDATWAFAEAAKALCAISHDSPEVSDQLFERLRSPHASVRHGVLMTLTEMGTDVAERTNVALELIEPLLDGESDFHFALPALASIGRDIEWARRKVLEFARPRPPQWYSPQDEPELKYDRVMVQRGAAIDAMQFLVNYPDECVPVLIDALTSFEEWDRDEWSSETASRIAFVLGEFGSKARSATMPLARLIADSADNDYPGTVLKALVQISPVDLRILPMLEDFQRRNVYSVFAPESDPVSWLICELRKLAESSR